MRIMLDPRSSKELAKKQHREQPKRLLSDVDSLHTWMKDIIHMENIDERVYYLGSHYLTRFLTMTEVNRNQLQLLAAACLLLSSKICSNCSLKSRKLIEYSDNQLLLPELLDMEMLLLSSFCWDLHIDTPLDPGCSLELLQI